MRRMGTIAVVLAAMGGAAAAQDADTPERRFQRAWYQELAEGRFEDARTAYEALAGDGSLDAALRAKALFRAGVCLQRLGRPDDAVKVFQRVAAEFAAVPAVAQEAQRQAQGETDAQAAFRQKLQSLIDSLQVGDDQLRLSAVHRLMEVGPEAAPQVLPVLAGSSFVGSQAAAKLLVLYTAAEPELVPTLLTAVAEGDPVVRKALLAEIERSKSAPLLAQLVGASRADVRAAAVRGLRWMPANPENVRALTALAQSGPAEVRREAIGSLGSFRTEAALDALIPLIGDPVAELRGRALDAVWGHCFETRAMSLLFDRDFRDTGVDLETLAGAAPDQFTGFRNSQQAVGLPQGQQAALATALQRVMPALTGAMRLRALGLCTLLPESEAAHALLGAAIAGQDLAAAQFVAAAIADRRCQPPVASQLRDAVASAADDTLRRLGYAALNHLGALDGLVAVLPRLEAGFQREVMRSLDQSKDDALVVAALRHFDAVSPHARGLLLEQAAKRKLAGAAPAIAAGLSDADTWVVWQALEAAARLPDPALAAPLAALIRDPRSETRFARFSDPPGSTIRAAGDSWCPIAVQALVAAGGSEVRPALEHSLKLQSERGRYHGLQALVQLGDPAAGPAVLAALGAEQDRGVQHLLIEAVRKLAPGQAAAALVAFLRRRNTENQSAAVAHLARLEPARAVAALRTVLTGEFPAESQVAAAAALPQIEHPDVRELILQSAWSPDSGVRRASLEGLRSLPLDPSLTPRLVELLRHPDQKARQLTRELLDEIRFYQEQKAALAGGGVAGEPGPAFRELLAMCESGAAAVRLAAVQALGRLGSRDALPALVRLRNDPDAAVRSAVEAVLDALSAPAEAPK